MSKIKTIKVGDVVYDIKAQYDGSGNNIETTYATKKVVDTRLLAEEAVSVSLPSIIYAGEMSSNIFENAVLFQIPTYTKSEDNLYSSYPDGFQEIVIEAATPIVAGIMSATDKQKLDGLNPNPVTDIMTYASSQGDSVELILYLDNGEFQDKTKLVPIPNATKDTAGVMSAQDKTKLDGIAASANNYTHPNTAGNKHIPAGGSSGQLLVNASDGSASWSNSTSFLDEKFQHINESVDSLSKEVQTITANEELYCYGVEWDLTVASPILTRIGNPLLHKSLPVQSAFRGCVANKNVVNYYLYPDNWAFKADGVTPSVLDGTDGTVRVHTPKFYGKSGQKGNKCWVKISTTKINDTWTEIPEMLIDAYRCTVDTTLTPKAVSVVNTTGAFRGGGNRTANDVYLGTDAFRSDLGKPRTNLSRANMRTYAVNAGSEMMCYEYYKWIFYWAYVIEYANFNSQATYNAELTSDGYRQGGLGDGVTTWNSDWNTYNGHYPLTPCGYCNEIGNFTGLKDLVIPGDAVTTKTFKVPRWRGFDNPFGDIWTNLDGIIIQGYTDEGTSTYNWKNVYTTTDPTKFGDAEAQKSQMKLTSNKETYSEGYTKAFDLKETAEIIPTTVGGGATTYMCDYHYTGGKDTSLRTLVVGGHAFHGTDAGLGYFHSYYGVGFASSYVGFRTLNSV